MAKKQTAGRDKLGTPAPKFAELNDDVLFGEVWPREEQLSARDRSMITIKECENAIVRPFAQNSYNEKVCTKKPIGTTVWMYADL